MDEASTKKTARGLVAVVLVEAVGSSITPFVPLPFVDDFLFARLLRRIARKILERTGTFVPPDLPKAIVTAYTDAGATPLAERALVAAARFVVRKVAVILDVKKSHDVFGEAIAFALALDVAAEDGVVNEATAPALGAAVHRALKVVGGGAIEVLVRATQAAFERNEAMKESSIASTRFERVAESVTKHVDDARDQIAAALRWELKAMRP
jgi:hypothetical protein